MIDLEIPIGKKTRQYRFFEMVPALISYGAIILLFVLSLISPLMAAIYLMIIIITLIVKAIGIAYHTIRGHNKLERAQRVDWRARLNELEDPVVALDKHRHTKSHAFGAHEHLHNLNLVASNPDSFPKPSTLYNAVIVATYNEGFDILEPTIKSVLNTTYDKSKLILVIAYEERGGDAIKQTVERLQKKYGSKFHSFLLIQHPKDIKDEVIGKGGNITHAGRFLRDWLPKQGIAYENVIITTLDSDNRPHPTYFDYVTYEYIVHEDRKNLSYQPVSLFLNNIWDAPAPMRVVATGNSFWNIISSMRPHTLRNFASHSQPMDALVEMDFWSTRTIVEDGHQYWRSYVHFNGNYAVQPLYVPIYQDAVLAGTYVKTLKAQFVQLRRWAYGASDVPYVASRIFTRNRNVPLLGGLGRLLRLIDGHVTLASVSLLVAFGGWVPLLINNQAFRDPVAHRLPEVISVIQQVAMIGLFVTVFLSLKMLPPRPARYRRHRTILMVAQWVLMPVTAIGYSSMAAFYSQTRLLFGRYLDKFDVTDKVTHQSVKKAKMQSKELKRAKKNKTV